MNIRLKSLHLIPNKAACISLPSGKLLINTINAHSYNVARQDEVFAEALTKCDILVPDGASIVKACQWINALSRPTERCAGWDLFEIEMQRLQQEAEACGRKKVMFVGSSEKVLGLIRERAAQDFPDLEVITLSPPYVKDFSEEQSREMVEAINAADPDLLWIGMTAPKQEKWTYQHWNELNIHCHCGCIGAVFDFYAGTVKRAPLWWQSHGLEWLHRLISEPRRMWRRYLIGNTKFLWYMMGEKFSKS